MTAAAMRALLDSDEASAPGTLPKYAWPGGYAMYYITQGGETLCAACAARDLLDEDALDLPVAYGSFGNDTDYPEEPELCDGCGEVICEPLD